MGHSTLHCLTLITNTTMNTLIVLTALVACAAAQYLAPHGYLGHAAYGHHGVAAYAPVAHAAYAAPAHHGYAAPAHHGYVAPAHHGYVAPAHHGYAPTYASQYHSQDEYGQASYGYTAPHQAKHEVRDHYGNVAGSYSYVNPEGKVVEVAYTAGVNGFQVHSNDLPVAPTADLELPVAPVYTGVAPEPVQNTPEVAAAKAAHLELLAAAGDRKKRSILAAPYAHHGYAAPAHHGFGYSFGYPAYAHGYAHHGAYAALPAVAAAHHRYAAPAVHHGYAAPVHHGYAAHAATYAAPAVVGREATLTRTILNPGHAEAYRVD